MSSFYDTRTKTIFIHVPKTAGLAIQAAVCGELPGTDGTVEGARFYRMGEHHWSANKIRVEYPDLYREATTFAIVRNPFSWLQSLYYYNKFKTHLALHNVAVEKGFGYFVREFTETDGRNMVKYVCDTPGNIIVDHVLRFESFGATIQPFLAKTYGLSTLPYYNTTPIKKAGLKEHYSDPALVDYVVENYYPDIEKFGYLWMIEYMRNK